MTAEAGLRDLGRTLRQARERKSWSIEQVAEATRITPRHLQAIEAGEFDRFPAPVYARGFMRAYAKALDLDEAAPLAVLDEAGLTAPSAARPAAAIAAGRATEAPSPAGEPARRMRAGRRSALFATGAVVAGARAGAVFLIASRMGDVRGTPDVPPSPFASGGAGSAGPAPAVAPAAPVRERRRPVAVPPTPAPDPAVLVVPVLPGFPVVVAVRSRQECVFQFQADDESRVRWWTLRAGEQTTFKAKRKLRLLVTNPGGIDAVGPGGPLPLTRGVRRADHFLVTPGGVERLALPPEATPAP